MKLFDDFEAVKFPEEDLIFITRDGYLYYIYDLKNKWWRKYRNAGNSHLTVSNYPDVSRKELINAMQGVFPQKETDFMRLCRPSQLRFGDVLALLEEDHSAYMADDAIYHAIYGLLLKSNICYRSFEKIQKLLDDVTAHRYDNSQVLSQIKDLSFAIIGRDIFKREIGIVDGHDSSSYFWIMPVRVIDYSNTNVIDNVARMKSSEISIEEDDVAQYLTPFLYKHYDDDLEANKQRIEDRWIDEDGNEQTNAVRGFEWNLTHNFFTFDSIEAILTDIKDTMDAMSTGKDNEFTGELRKKRGTSTYQLVYAKDFSDEEIAEYNANRPTEDDTEIELILDFYHRFIYRMEYMLKVGKEKGYNLISFMGP